MAQHAQFQLPDGTLVGTGNIAPPSLPALFSEFPQQNLLDDGEIKKLLAGDRHKVLRNKYRNWMINQASVGKCNASAAIGAGYRVRDKSGQSHVALADNYMYMHINDGQDRGSLLHHGMKFGKDTGIAPREIIDGTRKVGEIDHNAYNTRQVDPQLLQLAHANAPRFKFWEPMRIPTDYDLFRRTVATCLALDIPIVMAWDVTNASMRLRGEYIQSGQGMGNHASFFHSAKFVGGRDIVHPDLCNSWGPTASAMYGPQNAGWGDRGFGLMTMPQAFQCRQYHDFYAIMDFVQDPNHDVV